MQIVVGRFYLMMLFVFIFPKFQANAQNSIVAQDDTSFVYDEFPILVLVQEYKNFYLDVLYSKNNLLYINIDELFKTLAIPAKVSLTGDSITGFIENESHVYLIDCSKGDIKSGTKIFTSPHGLVKEMDLLYIESSLLERAFGIKLAFDFSSLTLQLSSNFELPLIKQLRIDKLRINKSGFDGEILADTILRRKYHFFKFGMLDWSIVSSQILDGSNQNSYSFGLGAELLYGEANLSLNSFSGQKLNNRQLSYLWRWVDNDKKLIKQAMIGRISDQTFAFINSPVIGAVIRNSATSVRKARGFYTINEFTEPNWTVELYLNNVMVDYTKADPSGAFAFTVPVVYGYTTLKLKFYGPLGEEHSENRTINVPYTIMSPKEFEYSLSIGIVQDSSLNRFGKWEFNYGVNRALTVGGGIEYLSSIVNGPFIPYATTTLQPFNRLTIYGEYAMGVRLRGLLDLYFSKDALLEIEYIKYKNGQQAVYFNPPEERKIKLSFPLKYKKVTGFSKLDFTQFVYNSFSSNQINAMVSTYFLEFSFNLSTQLNWWDHQPTYISSNLSLSYRLANGIAISPSAQYNISQGELLAAKIIVEKRVTNKYASISYERNARNNENLFSLNLKCDLPFAKTNVSASISRSAIALSESVQGSLSFNGGNHYIQTGSNSSLSKGGISLYPFLDLNHNGLFDSGEHKVKLNTVRILGGKIIDAKKDSIIRISDLNAFTSYFIELNDNNLENIAWRFRHKKYQVLIDPNQFKRIDIPIFPVGEISGMVYRDENNTMKGIGRIKIRFLEKKSSKVVAETLSESDGYFTYLGFEPGEFVARIDSAQLKDLNFMADPKQKAFTIKALEEGDVVSDVDFIIKNSGIQP
jgi:hypothetical protein